MIFYIIMILLFVGVLFICYYLYTKLIHKNKELIALQNTIEKKEQRNQKFISSLSQELRTPLYGIMGLINILSNEYPDLESNKNIKSLKFSGDYLLTLINNILQVNILENKKIITDNRSFDLKELVENIVNSFSYATKNSDNSLVLEYDTNIPEVLKGKPAILSQIIMNLISNALRFTRNGNIVFSVLSTHCEENINTISFKVVHDGNQISEEDEKSIYREFINIENIKKSYLGTGLNTTIIKRLAALLEGEIILQNNSTIGSEYVFIVDLETFDSSTDTNSITNEKQKVLIVDDNKLNLLVADKILSKQNFSCTSVTNGFDAITLTEDNSYDIILMDINMPKLNGIGTTKRIREFDSNTPIIALTGVDVTQLNRQIIRAGFNDYILKPYDKNVLLEMIQKHITN